MKKYLFFVAAGLIALASCSQDEVVNLNTNDAIQFNVLTQLASKGSETTTGTINEFTVESYIHGNTTNPYFQNVKFTKQADGTFKSDKPYYWPASAHLDFYAYNPSDNVQVEKENFKKFTITPTVEINCNTQVDFLYANTNDRSKTEDGARGVVINFRHAESKITVKAKNTSANLKFEVSDFKIVYLDKDGIFEYKDESTDTNSANLRYEDWSGNTDFSVANYYQQQASTTSFSAEGSVSPLTKEGFDWILVPQKTIAANLYESSALNAEANGSYIAIKLIIKNNTDGTVVYSGEDSGTAWAMWPVAFEWEPGKHYTYTVDLAGGGYYLTNQDADQDLDPILEDAVIKFVNVTVDDFDASDASVSIDVDNNTLKENLLTAASNVTWLSGDQEYTFNEGTLTLGGVKSTDLLSKTDDVNNNNLFIDIKSLCDNLNDGTIDSITYHGAKYSWNESLQCFWPETDSPSLSLEAQIATDLHPVMVLSSNLSASATILLYDKLGHTLTVKLKAVKDSDWENSQD